MHCRSCFLSFSSRPKLLKENDARADLIRFAFWTCSQLERYNENRGLCSNSQTLTKISDILAELDLPRSGIQDVVGVKYPKAFVEEAELKRMDDEDSTMMFYYSGQIHIRNVLNQIQSNLHPPDSLSTPPPPSIGHSQLLITPLIRCRECQPEDNLTELLLGYPYGLEDYTSSTTEMERHRSSIFGHKRCSITCQVLRCSLHRTSTLSPSNPR